MSFLSPRRRRALAAGVLVLALGAAGVSTNLTGAWFTASSSSPVTVSGALLSIGEIGKSSDKTTVAVADVYPMTDAQALANVAGAQAKSEWITVRNTGTIPLDWSMQIVNPRAKSPLTASQLAMFRFQLFTEAGAKLTDPLTLGSRPSVAVPDGGIASGGALAAGAQSKVEIRVWLDTSAGNEFQGAGASFDIVINAIQNGGSASMGPIALRAVSSGTPVGSSTTLTWDDASANLRGAGIEGTPIYSIERAENSDFSDATAIYKGVDRNTLDSAGGRATSSGAAVTKADLFAESSGWGLMAAQIGGEVYRWGYIFNQPVVKPVKITGYPAKLTALATSYSHMCGITDTEAYCSGASTSGVLGDGTLAYYWSPIMSDRAVKVKDLPVPSGTRLIDVATTIQSTCVLRSDGAIYCWGRHDNGQLGDAYLYDTSRPGRAAWSDTAHPPLSITAGRWGTYCAEKADGVACWGANRDNIVGAPGRQDVVTARAVNDPNGYLGAGVVDLDMSTAACAIAVDTGVYCWGSGVNGAFGDGNSSPGTSTVTPITAAGDGFTSIAVGSFSICGIKTDLTLWCWGRLTPGSDKLSAPTQMLDKGVLAGASSADLDGHAESNCATTDQRGIACWGSNQWGDLGDGTTVSKTIPTAPILNGTTVRGTNLSCRAAAILIGESCSLEPGRQYYYRLTYSTDGATWTSPPTIAERR